MEEEPVEEETRRYGYIDRGNKRRMHCMIFLNAKKVHSRPLTRHYGTRCANKK